MIFGLSIFEHKSELAKEMVKFIISNASAVTVREDSSKRYLVGLGVKSDLIEVLPDPAIGLSEVSTASGELLLQKLGCDIGKKKLISIAPRYFYWLWNDYERVSFLDFMASICDYIVESIGVDIVLVPQATYGIDNPLEDDIFLNREIHSRVKNKNNLWLISSRCTIDEVLGIYRLSELVVSSRRHACVFAATQNTPFLALSPRLYPPVSDFAADIESAANSIYIDDFDLNLAKRKIDSVWASKEIIRIDVNKTLSDKKLLVNRYIELASELIDSK